MSDAVAMPLAPPGWDGETGQLIRITSPDGAAVVWLAPRFGANCVGYAVRGHNGWVQLLHAAGPTLLAGAPIRYGCPLLFPFPGHVRQARYRWAGVEHRLPSQIPDRRQYTHGFAARYPWRMLHTGTDRAVATLSTAHDLPGGLEAAGYPFAITLTLRVALTDRALSLTLEAVNDGGGVAPVGLAFHPHFAVAALGGERTAVRVVLPGADEHHLAAAPPIPTGERRPVDSAVIPLPPLGQRLLVARTNLGPAPSASLSGPPGTLAITLHASAGCRDMVLFLPPTEPSIALEPHSCAPGAASQPEGHPDGLPGLAPGDRTALAITISATER